MASKDKYIRELETVRDTMLESFADISEQVDQLKAQNKQLIQELKDANTNILTYEYVLDKADEAYKELQKKVNNG